MTHWTILTCEYPPGCGGVGDYTAQVAAALAALGDMVTVFCPPRSSRGSSESGSSVVTHAGVEVVVLEDVYGRRGRRAIDERLNGTPQAIPSTILVQYVPTGFGLRGANMPWCRWLLERSRRPGTDVRVMFHEPYFEFTRRPVLRNVLALAQRLMAKMLLRSASRVYVSTDAWRRYLAPHMPARRSQALVTLPIPSAIPRCHRAPEIAARRTDLLGSSSTRLVGHFGTFGSEVAPMLATALIRLLNDDATISAVCIGSGSEEFARSLAASSPTLGERIHGGGRVSAPEAALTLSACDLLLQPYPDGVTTRRTSIMAGLINARAIVTTTGHLTEPVWTDTGAVALADAHDTESFVGTARSLLAKDDDRAALAARGETAYRELFALSHTIRALRGAVEGAAGMNGAHLAIGITTRNRPEALQRCLRSLTVVAHLSPEVFVFDDASSPSVRDQIGAWDVPVPVRVLRDDSAPGVVVGRNRLVAAASAPAVFLMDDDAAFHDAESIERALRLLDVDRQIGAIAFAQCDTAGTRWDEGMQPSRSTVACYVAAFIGFGHLLSREAFNAVGGYRESLLINGEEKELCLRLIDAGYRIVYLPDALVIHQSDPAGRSPQRYLRNITRNDCLSALYNEPLHRLAWLVPARLALYFHMRRAWKTDDPWGWAWVLRELWNNAGSIYHDRKVVSPETVAAWKRLRKAPEPYVGKV